MGRDRGIAGCSPRRSFLGWEVSVTYQKLDIQARSGRLLSDPRNGDPHSNTAGIHRVVGVT